MKTSKKDFGVFKEEFLLWQKNLGLMAWEIIFVHKRLKDAAAQINADSLSRMATVALSSVVAGERDEWNDPKACGKHEAIHLLLADLDWLARQRYTSERELDREEEGIVRRLEKIL